MKPVAPVVKIFMTPNLSAASRAVLVVLGGSDGARRELARRHADDATEVSNELALIVHANAGARVVDPGENAEAIRRRAQAGAKNIPVVRRGKKRDQ